MSQLQTRVEDALGELEGTMLALLGRLATWLTPVVPAILLARSSVMVFQLEGRLALVVAVIIAVSMELIGLEAVHAWARARHWNHERDPAIDAEADERKAGRFILYYLLVAEAFIFGFGVHIGVTTGWWWELLGALFPPFSYLSAQLMNERDLYHLRRRRRAMRLAEERDERERKRLDRQAARAVKSTGNVPGNVSVKFPGRVSDEEVLSIFSGNPAMSLREAGNVLGMSHTAVKNRLDVLEQQGRVGRNGRGVEVRE